jgi:hypothetical protein
LTKNASVKSDKNELENISNVTKRQMKMSITFNSQTATKKATVLYSHLSSPHPAIKAKQERRPSYKKRNTCKA